MGFDPPAEGWYDDPTGRHELRWFSAGCPTDLIRDAGIESRDALSAEERALRATTGPGLDLPEKSGPTAWWDAGASGPDVNVSGLSKYSLERFQLWRAELRMNDPHRLSRWSLVALVVAAGFIAFFALRLPSRLSP
jgi:hypothetical protein